MLDCRLRRIATIRETAWQRAVKLALDLVQAAQDQGEAVGAGHDHQSNSERKEEAPASTSGRGLNWQRTPLVRSCLGEWQKALSLPHPRAEPPLVAQTPSEDLFIGAKDLFGAAIMVLQKPSSLLIEYDGLIRFEERPLDHRLRQSVPLQYPIIEPHQHFELCERCLPKLLV